MQNEFLNTIRTIVAAGWRRRYLLSLPILVMLPLCLLWALYGPRTYIAKSLMLLQETQSSNPLAQREYQATRIQERIAGLQALLKSERVMGAVYRDLTGDSGTNGKDMAAWMRDFSQYLSLELIGSDFLEFQLKGGNPRGLGKRLEAVTTRYLEALSPDAPPAIQVLHDRRREEMEHAERAVALFRQDLQRSMPGGMIGMHSRLEEARKQLLVRDGELLRINNDLQDTRARVAATGALSNRIEQDIAQARAELAGLEQRNGAEADLTRARGRLADLMAIQRLDGRRGSIETEVKTLSQETVLLMQTLQKNQPAVNELSRLERVAAQAKEQHDQSARRITVSNRPVGILNAPERIKLIDAPRDPEFPSNSALRIAVIVLLASILLALGLAVFSELLDQKLRSAEQAARATKLPVLVRLP